MSAQTPACLFLDNKLSSLMVCPPCWQCSMVDQTVSATIQKGRLPVNLLQDML